MSRTRRERVRGGPDKIWGKDRGPSEVFETLIDGLGVSIRNTGPPDSSNRKLVSVGVEPSEKEVIHSLANACACSPSEIYRVLLRASLRRVGEIFGTA